eukprot:TRINITY_DN1501_c0_g1_i1.p2 TRINITY_DN1501_c0_g1~~TRINITY_DN1501_c0_g1_i1.p2  ORF type:complete len:313 (+),score=48.20 TRINITY_DN1501_c0_g1_i1:23-940(+)
MATPTCLARLRKELRNLHREPPPHVTARPVPSNMLRWLFVIEGPPDTPYAGGLYVGRLEFPNDYPFHPPTLYMHTPSGRFETGVSVCMSMTSAHVESWNPIWGLSTILSGFLSFMTSDELTAGAIRSSDADKLRLARKSHAYNRKDKTFRELFPEFVRSDPAGGSSTLTASDGSSDLLSGAPAGPETLLSPTRASPTADPPGAAVAATAAAAAAGAPAGTSGLPVVATAAGGGAEPARAPAGVKGPVARAGRGTSGAAAATGAAAGGATGGGQSSPGSADNPLALVGWLTVLVAIITFTYQMIAA